MDFEITWTEPALSNLEEIVVYISHDNPAAAERTGKAILDHVEILRSFPFIGPSYPLGSHGINRETAYKDYRIFYRVKERSKMVEILAVWHGSRLDPPLPE